MGLQKSHILGWTVYPGGLTGTPLTWIGVIVGMTVGNLQNWTITRLIVGLAVVTFIGICSGKDIFCSGVGVGSVVGMPGGA